jgi:hypothetical protein
MSGKRLGKQCGMKDCAAVIVMVRSGNMKTVDQATAEQTCLPIDESQGLRAVSWVFFFTALLRAASMAGVRRS